jgi:beta-phosphoglucomutase-like phosphatase (HAD superfamily)
MTPARADESYLLSDDITAMIFGVDGVVLDTLRVSAETWRSVLDPFLRSYVELHDTVLRPFRVPADYLRYFYGRPRTDGLADFLASRLITLPFDDLRGMAVRQEELFLSEARRLGTPPYQSTVGLVRTARQRKLATAAVSAESYAAELLELAGAAALFDVRLDATDATGVWRPGDPEQILFLEVARRTTTPPERTAVVESRMDGVAAAKGGGFGVVIGVDRAGRPDALRERGANAVLSDLSGLRFAGPPPSDDRPSPSA